MTQSGQGEEPSARPAREGIVLPSDGGEPLLPGMTGGAGGPSGARPSGPHPTGQVPASAPPGGQAWDQPWGPDQHQAPPPPPGQGWQTPSPQPWNTPEPGPWGAQGPAGGTPPSPSAPLPFDGTQPPHSHLPAPQQPTGAEAYGPPAGGAPLPPAGAGGSMPSGSAGGYGSSSGAGGAGGPQPSGGAQAYGSFAEGTAGGPPNTYGPPTVRPPLPPAGPGAPQPSGDANAGAYWPPAGSAPLPPAGSAGGPGAPVPSPYADAYGAHPTGAPLPPPADEGATKYLPPVAARADEGATQYISPVGSGALPPEMPAESDPEATRFLGRAKQGPRGGAGPLPPAANPDAEATQYIAPVPGQTGGTPYGIRPGGGDRQPPSEFDGLFRSGAVGESPAVATQQLPRFEQPQPRPGQSAYGAQPPYPAPQPSYPAGAPAHDPAPEGGGRGGRGGRSGSRVPLIAAVGVGIAVLGIGAGALLSGGGGSDTGDNDKTVSATAPAADGSASPSADPARQQAVELDRLLADSGNSRTAVIRAVANVKACTNLAQAAKDLRDAAGQRTQLVTRLSGLQVDQLPNHVALTAALTKAWEASASADNHYAAWADQIAAKKGNLCRKGQARPTAQQAAGNRASGIASAKKAEAAPLWNAIARTYGLTERQPVQL